MWYRTGFVLFLLSFPSLLWAKGSQGDKPDNSPKGKLMQDIQFLCMGTLGGRLTGSDGERLAADYIQTRFETLGLAPFKGLYKWDFTMQGGSVLGKNAYFKINHQKLQIGNDVQFLPFSFGNELMGSCLPGLDEEQNVWLVPLSKLPLQKTNTPIKFLYDYARTAQEGKAQAVVFYNDQSSLNDITWSNNSKYDMLEIPVAVMSHAAYNQYLKPAMKKDWVQVEAKLGYEQSSATGKNVMGYIDNRAPLTVIIAANYDHIGNFGGRYPGADNNASGVAGLFYLADQVKTLKLLGYNYLFIAFSGKEQDLQGSAAFLKQNENWLNGFSCMINLDMIGRYRSGTKSLYVSGVGTSPLWPDLLSRISLGYGLQIDSCGMGYCDMNSFYQKNIPVLRFSSGYHDDYQTEQDVPSKINADGEIDLLNFVMKALTEISRSQRPAFTKAPDVADKLKNLRVDMGIMPDFSFNEDGIRIGACLKNKLANKAGFQSGDVIVKIGEYPIVDYDDYIKAIKKSSDDRETPIVVRRGKDEFKFFVLLN